MLTQELEFVRGDRFTSKTYEVWDEEANSAVDLTAYDFAAHAKVSPMDTDPVFSFQVDVVDSAAGRFRLVANPSETENLTLPDASGSHFVYFVFDVQMTHSSDPNQRLTPVGGRVKLRLDVTR